MMKRVRHGYAVLRSHPRPLRLVLARLLVSTGLCTWFTIPQQGYRLRFYPSNLSELLWVEPTCREAELRLIRACLRPGDRVVDVGANVGDTALAASRAVGADGRVWAIEAHPRTFAFLQGNIALNRVTNIVAVRAAAAAAAGRLRFSDERRDDINRVAETGLDVEALPLDELVCERGRIDLLKLDVEGYELHVLGGASDTLARTRLIVFEAAERHVRHFGYELPALLTLLVDRGFTLLRPRDGSTRVERIDATFKSTRVENLLAVRDVREFEARSGWTVSGLGPGTWGLGPGAWGLGPGAWGLGPEHNDRA